MDYVYPFSGGQLPKMNPFTGLDYSKSRKVFDRINHPVQVGFEQNYDVAVNLGKYGDFRDMMRSIWRVTYDRMRDKLFNVDNANIITTACGYLTDIPVNTEILMDSRLHANSQKWIYPVSLSNLDLSGSSPVSDINCCVTATKRKCRRLLKRERALSTFGSDRQ